MGITTPILTKFYQRVKPITVIADNVGICLPPTCKINHVNRRFSYVDMHHNYIDMQPIYVNNMQHNYCMLHADMNNSNVYIIITHVDILYLASSEHKYATITDP